MIYYKTIISFFVLSAVSIILSLYFANLTRSVEKNNFFLKEKIIYIQDQININELEYSLYNNYKYLNKIQKIYFEDSNKINSNIKITFSSLNKKSLQDFHTVGIK